MHDPWLLTREYIDEAERAVVDKLGPGVESLLRPTLRPEHALFVERIARLPWREDQLEPSIRKALTALVDATGPGGPIDPADDAGDVPWCAALSRVVGAPVIGSKMGRQWFALLQRFRWNDVRVSPIAEGVAAYAVALMEHLRRRDSEARYWMRLAAIQNEDDDRVGLGVAVVVRAARLLTGGTT